MARQSRPPPFLLTRPAEQSARFAEDLRLRFGAGIRVISSPLLVPEFLRPVLPRRPLRGVIFTSETAVQAFQRLSAEPAFAGLQMAWCVGDRTAAAARTAGLPAISAKGDASDLIRLLLAAQSPGPLLHLRGEEARGSVTEILEKAGIETVSVVCYAQRPQPLSQAARDVLLGAEPVLVPLFSPRTATIFAAEMRRFGRGAPLLVAALSPAVAEAVVPLVVSRLVVAANPDAPAMLTALSGLILPPQHA